MTHAQAHASVNDLNLAGAETRPYPLAVVERGRGRRLTVQADAGGGVTHA